MYVEGERASYWAKVTKKLKERCGERERERKREIERKEKEPLNLLLKLEHIDQNANLCT